MIHFEATRDMTPQEYLGNLILLIVGGNDTMRNSMSALPIVNRQWPDEWGKLRGQGSLVANATQKLVRWQTPLAHMNRTALGDHEIGGKLIQAGQKVVLWYVSGNRDEVLFPNGDRFIADRDNARRHLAFGFGIHRCVGARLAELQLATLVEALLDRGLMPVQTAIRLGSMITSSKAIANCRLSFSGPRSRNAKECARDRIPRAPFSWMIDA